MIQHIIVADDHSMIRKGIKLLLMTRLGCQKVDEADSCNTLMNELKKGTCTHIILDVVFSDGTSLEMVPVIKRLYPTLNIMIFTMQPSDIYSDAFRQYGIYYYLSKSSSEEEAVLFLRRFLNNETAPYQHEAGQGGNPFSTLAPRELEILHYLLSGYKTSEIAKTLNLGNSTISTFKMRIFEKTNTNNLSQLYEMAVLHNLNLNSSSAANNE